MVQRHAQNMIYDAVVCVNAAQESCITEYNNMLPTHFLPEGEVFYTLIFASCQIQSPSACYIIKDGSGTYQHCHSPYKDAMTCNDRIMNQANLSNLSHLYSWNMSSRVYNSHPFCLNNNGVKDTCKQMSGLQSKHPSIFLTTCISSWDWSLFWESWGEKQDTHWIDC